MIKLILAFPVLTLALKEEICEKNLTGPTVCSFELKIRHRQTLTGLINGREYPIQYKSDRSGFEFRPSGYYFQTDFAYITSKIPIGADITPNVTNPILADGTPDQLVITINDDYVGPTLIVPEGAFVAVKVVNMLENQELLLHFHGMHQKGSWAYDGSRTTQCPIYAGHEFTYRFKADPAGTHIYHSHVVGQKRDGLFGAFIVRRDLEDAPVPLFVSENGPHYNYGGTSHIAKSFFINNAQGNSNTHPSKRIYLNAHQELGAGIYETAMINGVGQNANIANTNKLFTVTPGKKLALISMAGDGAYEVTIDGHDLQVIETDGYKTVPRTFHAVTLNPGETIVVIAIRRSSSTVNSFIRFSTIGEFWADTDKFLAANRNSTDDLKFDLKTDVIAMTDEEKLGLSAFAILEYDPLNVENFHNGPSSFEARDDGCDTRECHVLNCNQDGFRDRNVICVSVADLNAHEDERAKFDQTLPLHSEIISLKTDFRVGAHWNGYKTSFPLVPLTQTNLLYETCTDREASFNKGCTFIQSLPENHRVRILLTSGEDRGYVWEGNHPIHMHGHHFKVLAQGYGGVGPDGVYEKGYINDRLSVGGTFKVPQWGGYSVYTHYDFNMTGLSLNENGPYKDVVQVSNLGWVLIELETTNPGIWMLHCHVGQHIAEGMNMWLKVGDTFPATPEGFSSCDVQRNAGVSVDDFESFLGRSQKWPFQEEEESTSSNYVMRVNFIALSVIIFLAL